jgi:hypothetical protein
VGSNPTLSATERPQHDDETSECWGHPFRCAGSVTSLFPLYTVRVLPAFTLSQGGMVQHWRNVRDQVPRLRLRAAVNGLGALTTAVVAVQVAVSNFMLGAWKAALLFHPGIVVANVPNHLAPRAA